MQHKNRHHDFLSFALFFLKPKGFVLLLLATFFFHYQGGYLEQIAGSNNNFIRINNSTKMPCDTHNETKQQRIRLNLANKSGTCSQILVGYNSEATMGFDKNLDGQLFGGNGVTFYSIIPKMNLAIQSRPFPFEEDTIQLGYKATKQNTYQITIDHLDDLFCTHGLYLVDKKTNTIHDLKTAPYLFTSDIGTFNDRFVLRFNNITLKTGKLNLHNNVKIVRGNELEVHSVTQKIKNIIAFDLLGHKIDIYKNNTENKIILKKVKKASGIILLKITLENDTIIYRKTIF